ncbi:hypothetical protein NM688_g1660 [Phlebia brevispora]|uniref:Uncharacterized protein n=1 Tax=Phlebia brevispora TaxID=194682 RepID=A0ACC1TB27_9APHY|nr:hypothetical protein NM688_g1660 [Phlebia brevispora]
MAASTLQQDTVFQGVLLTCIAYGVVATLCVQCLSMLYNSEKRMSNVRLLAFVGLIFAASTIFQGAGMKVAQDSFVYDPSISDGPQAYEVTHFSRSINILANAMIIILCFFSDALLLWCCTVIYRSLSIPNFYGAFIVCMFWCSEFAIGTLFLTQISSPSGTLWTSINFNLAFWSLSLAINIIATTLISARILYCRHYIRRLLNHKPEVYYTSIVAVMVESALFYTAFLLLYIILFALNNPVESVFVQPIAFAQTIASMMIIYRVAQGKAWSSNTYDKVTTDAGALSTLQFSTGVSAEHVQTVDTLSEKDTRTCAETLREQSLATTPSHTTIAA